MSGPPSLCRAEIAPDDYRFKEIHATGLAPSSDRESVVITTLANGSYTVIVSGYGGATGVGLVEVYNLR